MDIGGKLGSRPRVSLIRRLSFAMSVVALTVACASGSSNTAPSTKHLRIAFFAAASQNGFNAAVYEGIQSAASKAGDVETRIFDGQFNPSVQYNQVESAVAAKNFDGAIIVANDNVGVAPGIQHLIAANIKTCAALFPIGPSMFTLDPQVQGLTCTAAYLPAPGAGLAAEQVANFCANKNPCRVVLIPGILSTPFDKLRYDTWRSVLGGHSNIQIVATGEGFYSRDTGRKVMTDILQAHPQFDALLSNADQQTEGALIALKNRGWDVKSMLAKGQLFIMSSGTTQEAVAAMRNGEISAEIANYPSVMGQMTADSLISALRGKPYTVAIDMDKQGPLLGVITPEILAKHPDFKGDWSG